MKKLIFFMSFAIIAFYGCEKSEMNPSSENQEVEKSSVAAFVLNLSDETTYEVIYLSQEEMQGETNQYKSSNSAHTHGTYHGGGGSTVVTFNGTQNKGGSHGSAELQLATPFGNAHVIMKTVSVIVDGNEAIYGGIVTEVIENTLVIPPPPPPPPGFPPPPPPPTPYLLGSHTYFKVLDNGQGNNADPDQYHGLIVSTSNPIPDGGVGLPWFFSTFMDVENESDKIKVN